MKKLFKLLFDQLETVGSENIDNFSGGFWAAHGAADKQGTLTLFFCVVKPLYKQFFDCSFCVDMGSKGFRTAYFTWKMKINHLEIRNVPFPWKTLRSFGFFQSHGKNFLIKNMVHTCVFQENHSTREWL